MMRWRLTHNNNTMQQGCGWMVLFALLWSLSILFSPSSAVRLTVSPRPCFLPEQWKLIGSTPAAPVAGSKLRRLDRKHTHKVLVVVDEPQPPKGSSSVWTPCLGSRSSIVLQYEWLYSILFLKKRYLACLWHYFSFWLFRFRFMLTGRQIHF